MSDLVFKKIPKEDEQKVRNLINIVIGGLERKEYFIPYEEWELNSLFDESYAPLHGCYDGDKLVGMAQLYISQEMLKEFKEVLGISEFRVCELGGNLVLPEYRGRGITSELHKIQYDLAKELGFDYIISMAHPDNVGSLKALQKIGLEYVKTTTVANGHLRDVYCKKLK
jgi:RimJ/RimL family protein N-acetyltransferase